MKKLINENGEVLSSFQGKSGTVYKLNTNLNIQKYIEYQKLSLSYAYGLSFQQFYDNLNKAMELANGVPTNKNSFTDLVLHLNALQTSILESNQVKYDQSLYLMTLFLDYDHMPSKWSVEDADKVIEDLQHYDAQDVFFLISHLVNDYRKIVEKLNGSIQTQMEDIQKIRSTENIN